MPTLFYKLVIVALLNAIVAFAFLAFCHIPFLLKKPICLWEELANDPNLGFLSVTFSGQQKVVVINDQHSMDYLIKAMRMTGKEEPFFGSSFTAHFELTNGKTIPMECFLRDPPTSITLNCFINDFEDPQFFVIHLTEPMPDSLSLALRQLHQ